MKETDIDVFIELLTKSFGFMGNRVADNPEKQDSLNLLKSIFSYRDIPDRNQVLIERPDLINQKDYIDLLWKHFDSLSQEALSELFIETIHDIYD